MTFHLTCTSPLPGSTLYSAMFYNSILCNIPQFNCHEHSLTLSTNRTLRVGTQGNNGTLTSPKFKESVFPVIWTLSIVFKSTVHSFFVWQSVLYIYIILRVVIPRNKSLTPGLAFACYNRNNRAIGIFQPAFDCWRALGFRWNVDEQIFYLIDCVALIGGCFAF